MKTSFFVLRHKVSALVIHIGLAIMPNSIYKRELLRRMWELRWEIEEAVDSYNKENNNGNK